MAPINLKIMRFCALLISAGILLPLIPIGCQSPERSPGELQNAYNRGLAALEMFDYNEAYLQLVEVQPYLSQDDPRWLEATYSFALANWHRPPPNKENIERALALFQALLREDIPDNWRTRVRLSLARIYEIKDYPDDTVDIKEARSLYEMVRQEYPAGEFGYQATLRLAQTYVQELNQDSVQEAIKLIQAQIERDPNSLWAAIAWQYMGDLYANALLDPAAALAAYQKTESLGFPNESRAHIYLYRMANWATELGQENEAVRLLTRIVTDYPRSPYGTMARDRVREYANAHPDKGITPPELQSW